MSFSPTETVAAASLLFITRTAASSVQVGEKEQHLRGRSFLLHLCFHHPAENHTERVRIRSTTEDFIFPQPFFFFLFLLLLFLSVCERAITALISFKHWRSNGCFQRHFKSQAPFPMGDETVVHAALKQLVVLEENLFQSAGSVALTVTVFKRVSAWI